MPTHRLLPLLLALTLVGCDNRQITTYRTAKDPLPADTEDHSGHAHAGSAGQLPSGHPPIDGSMSAPANMASTPVATANGPGLVWSAPETWTAKPLSPMRKGSYTVRRDGAEADLAITAFPGDTGGLTANLNRWRGQVGQPPLDEAALRQSVEHLTVGGLDITLTDISGGNPEQPVRLLGAIVPYQGQTWFFKLLGPETVVSAEKDTFRAFLLTIKESQP